MVNGIPHAAYAVRRTDHDPGGDRNDGASSPATTRTTPVVDENFPPEEYQKYQSDVIVDLLHHYEFEDGAINPGASFRGLHDSIVNYGGNRPAILMCQHEETAVQIAHGYARATGRPMATIAGQSIFLGGGIVNPP